MESVLLLLAFLANPRTLAMIHSVAPDLQLKLKSLQQVTFQWP
jgi:hypothetical protein